MPPDVRTTGINEDGAWVDRQRQWARKLSRLRLGAEPLAVQLARRRRVTWALTAVASTIGLIYVALFAAFGRPGLGAIMAGLVIGPVVALAWLDLATLSRRAVAYEREQRDSERLPGEPGAGTNARA